MLLLHRKQQCLCVWVTPGCPNKLVMYYLIWCYQVLDWIHPWIGNLPGTPAGLAWLVAGYFLNDKFSLAVSAGQALWHRVECSLKLRHKLKPWPLLCGPLKVSCHLCSTWILTSLFWLHSNFSNSTPPLQIFPVVAIGSSRFCWVFFFVYCSLKWNIVDWVTQEMRLGSQVVLFILQCCILGVCDGFHCRGTWMLVMCLQCLFTYCIAGWGRAINSIVTKHSIIIISNQMQSSVILMVEKHLATMWQSLPFRQPQKPVPLQLSCL